MKKLTKYLKSLFAICFVSNSDLTNEDTNDPIFKIAVETPYPVNDIKEFMELTGIPIIETGCLMKRFSESGISNVRDINTLYKLGFFHYC